MSNNGVLSGVHKKLSQIEVKTMTHLRNCQETWTTLYKRNCLNSQWAHENATPISLFVTELKCKPKMRSTTHKNDQKFEMLKVIAMWYYCNFAQFSIQ